MSKVLCNTTNHKIVKMGTMQITSYILNESSLDAAAVVTIARTHRLAF